jgi:hypothetical protein
MYKVIAKLKSEKESIIKCWWLMKTYQKMNMAEKFVNSQLNHSTHYFEIEKVAA